MNNLENIALNARKLIIKTVYENKCGHLGGPLSATDILTALYFDVMRIDPKNPKWENRDRFILSKGHSAVALYSTLALKGYFDIEELKTFDKINSRLQAHPDMALLPGLDFSTGSLGQGISGAVGMALAAKLQNKDYMTYCMIGDGESQEGQVWEAADIASRYELDNLVVILDANYLQQYGFNKDVPIYYPYSKFHSFGWNVMTINGHSFESILFAFHSIKEKRYRFHLNKPTIIIANTVKGKGISFMEGEKSWHSRVPTKEEYELAIKELS